MSENSETPTTDQVRHVYVAAPDEYGMELSSRQEREYGEAFDRWLREHEAQVRAESEAARANLEAQLEQTSTDVARSEDLGIEWMRAAKEARERVANLEAVIASVRDLIPEGNPELLDNGYTVDAGDVLERLMRAGDPVVLREHDAKVLRDALGRMQQIAGVTFEQRYIDELLAEIQEKGAE